MAKKDKNGNTARDIISRVVTKEEDKNSTSYLIKSEIKKYESNQAINPFNDIVNGVTAGSSELAVIEPSFDAHKLLMLVNLNDILKQLIKACRINTVGNGWTLEYIGKEEDRETDAITEEHDKYHDLISRPNQNMTGQEMLNAIADDHFSISRSYMEITRAKDGSGEIICLFHIPGSTMLKTKHEKDSTIVNQRVMRRGREFNIPVERHFKRFVQKPETDLSHIYFKEYGDPRRIDKRNGGAEGELRDEEESRIADMDLANEVLELADYEPGHIYALPIWVNQITKVLGSKLADDVNMSFFENNMIPSMIIGVSGGMATKGTMERIQKKFADFTGIDSMHKLMFLEFAGDPDSSAEDGSIPRPEIIFKDLHEARQNDAIFSEFKKEVNTSIMSSFRIPPILLGLSTDYTESTARVAILMAESQVFKPARNLIESYFNNYILIDEVTGLPSKNWRFKLKPTNIFNEEGVFDAVEVGAKNGALTPNDIINILNDNLGMQVTTISEEWGNLPANVTRDIFLNHLEALKSEGKSINIDKLESLTKTLEELNNDDEPNTAD